jgi:hypothetical protein
LHVCQKPKFRFENLCNQFLSFGHGISYLHNKFSKKTKLMLKLIMV